MPTRIVTVQLPDSPYQVHIGPGVLDRLGPLTAAALGDEPFAASLIVDANLPPAHSARAAASLEQLGIATHSDSLEPSEPAKSLATLERLLVLLTRAGHGRLDPVIALGGGIVGDVAGFAAASYQRGCPVVQCPTTLLAMVDASVGGKTGVNLSLGDGTLVKNMAGAFHQPRLVLADVTTLASLDPRVFRAGLAECVKHALLAADWNDPSLLDWTRDHADAILAHDPGTLVELITRQVALKARVVAADERELASSAVGGRALLNLGHTFAHAIEPIATLAPAGRSPPLMHGEAVALGLVAACRTAVCLGLADESLGEAVRSLLATLGLPTAVAGLPDAETIRGAMGLDKKVRRGALRLVLPTEPGRCVVVDDPPADAVVSGIEAMRPA